MVKFKTLDDKLVKVEVELVEIFCVVKDFFNGDFDDHELENTVFPLPNVSSYILNHIVYVCKLSLAVISKYEAVEKQRQEFETNFFGQLSDKTIVDLVKAADYLEIEEVLDFVMPSVRKRFRLGDDKGVEFVYTAEAEAILLRRAASARKR